MERTYAEYAARQAMELLAIDSPTGFTARAADWVQRAFEELGYTARRTVKGGVLVDLGGRGEGLLLEAHADTLGGMVAEVKNSGRLRLTPLGGMRAENGEAENVRVYTRGGRVLEGTFQLCNASVHVNGQYGDTKRTFDSCEVVLDEDVKSAEETRTLGVEVGDVVCFEPRTRLTASGYIKSRFLDDKLSVGILLGLAKYLKDTGTVPQRHVYLHVTVYEEVGHGGAANVPQGVTEAISVDMGAWARGCNAPSGRYPSAPRTPAARTAMRWWASSSMLPAAPGRTMRWTCLPTTAPMWRRPCRRAMTCATASSAPGSTPATVMSAAMWTGCGIP